MADDLAAVDRALLIACDLAEAAPLVEARARLVCDLIRMASTTPSDQLSVRLSAAIETGERIAAHLARLRFQASAELRRAGQLSHILG